MKSFRDTEQPLLVSLQPLSLSTVRRLGAEQNALMGLAHRGRKGISPGQEVLAEGGPGGHLEAAPCIQAPGFPTFPLCNLVVGFVISSLPSWSRGGGRMDRAASHLRGGPFFPESLWYQRPRASPQPRRPSLGHTLLAGQSQAG